MWRPCCYMHHSNGMIYEAKLDGLMSFIKFPLSILYIYILLLYIYVIQLPPDHFYSIFDHLFSIYFIHIVLILIVPQFEFQFYTVFFVFNTLYFLYYFSFFYLVFHVCVLLSILVLSLRYYWTGIHSYSKTNVSIRQFPNLHLIITFWDI